MGMSERVPGLAAIILAGGQSRRMGRPKAWLPVAGETFLQRIVRTVSSVAGEVVVVAAAGQSVPDLPEAAAVVCDPIERGGPLVALETGWHALRTHPAYVFVCGCDTPLLRPDFVRAVAGKCVGREAAVPVTHGIRHPLAACYAFDVLPRLAALVAGGERRMQAFLDGLAMYELHADEFSSVDPTLESLVNINTPEDWAVWRDRLSSAVAND